MTYKLLCPASTESQSDTELMTPEAVDLSSAQSGSAPFPEQRAGSSDQPKHRTASNTSPASKPGQGQRGTNTVNQRLLPFWLVLLNQIAHILLYLSKYLLPGSLFGVDRYVVC